MKDKKRKYVINTKLNDGTDIQVNVMDNLAIYVSTNKALLEKLYNIEKKKYPDRVRLHQVPFSVSKMYMGMTADQIRIEIEKEIKSVMKK